MSGIGLVLDIARNAMTAQRYGIDVTAHNIANVNTAGYSRQRSVYEAKAPQLNNRLLFGQGVEIALVSRVSDQFVENQLMKQEASVFYSEEMEKYMQIMEGLFSENTDASISTMLSDFWNLWHDISNNPMGLPERSALYEHSILLSEQFNTMDDDLWRLENNLTDSISGGIDKINQITSMIATLNKQIVGTGSDSIANDLRDRRNMLLSELSGYIDVNSFEQDYGTVTVVTARGCTVVQGASSYDVQLGGANGDRVEWQSSGGTTVDITDHISVGKLGGWLDMRDEIVAKYKLDLDAVSKEFISTVNGQHSQGVGLEAFSTVTGTYKVSDNAKELGTQDSGLDYYNKVSDGAFKLWVYDSGGAGVATSIDIDADAGGTTLTALMGLIDGVANISATITSAGSLKIDGDSGYTFAFSEDTSGVLAALGINTFFSGAGAGSIGINTIISVDRTNIATAQINIDGTFAKGDNANALLITDLQYSSRSISQWTVDRIDGNTEGSVTGSIEDYYHGMVGSMGVVSAGISRSKAFNEMMANKMSEMRDSISAVSLDEEMTNLIKYQHAYTAAAKLVQISNEMLNVLLELV